VVGGDRPPLRFSTIFCRRPNITRELLNVFPSVSSCGLSAELLPNGNQPRDLAPNGVRGRIRHAVGLLENADYVALDVAIAVHVRAANCQIIGLPMVGPS
jgi:hypothetical protein